MNKKFSNLFDGELVSELQEKGCQILTQAGYSPVPVDSATFERSRTREVMYVNQTTANAIGVLMTADITIDRAYVSYGPPNAFLPTGITDKQRAIYIALLILLAPIATFVILGWLIFVGLAYYSNSKAVVIVRLQDGSYLQVARLDE